MSVTSKMRQEAQIVVDFCDFMDTACPNEIELLGKILTKWGEDGTGNLEEGVMTVLYDNEDSMLNGLLNTRKKAREAEQTHAE